MREDWRRRPFFQGLKRIHDQWSILTYRNTALRQGRNSPAMPKSSIQVRAAASVLGYFSRGRVFGVSRFSEKERFRAMLFLRNPSGVLRALMSVWFPD